MKKIIGLIIILLGLSFTQGQTQQVQKDSAQIVTLELQTQQVQKDSTVAAPIIDSVTIVEVEHSGLANAKRLIEAIKQAKPDFTVTEGMGPILRLYAADTALIFFKNTEELKVFFKSIEKDSNYQKKYELLKVKVTAMFAVLDIQTQKPEYKIFGDTVAAYTKKFFLTNRIVVDGYTDRSDEIVDSFLMIHDNVLTHVKSSWLSDSAHVCNIYADSANLVKMLKLYSEFNQIREAEMVRVIMAQHGHKLYHVGALHSRGLKKLLPKANFIDQYTEDEEDIMSQDILYFHTLSGQQRSNAIFNLGQLILSEVYKNKK